MSNKDDKKEDDSSPVVVLTSAPPPFHTVLALGLLSVVFACYCPSMERLDEVATVETFTRVLFPQIMNVHSLAYIRLIMALTVWWTTFATAVLSDGSIIFPTYLPGSKLKRRVPIRLKGIRALCPFTCWSWILLGVSFTLNAYIAIQGAAGIPVDHVLLRVAVCVWEISAPCTLLVSSVIRYAIWPFVLAHGNTSTLKTSRVMIMHNMNSVYAVTELALMGGLPVRLSELSLLPLYGMVYVIFTWCMSKSWTDKPSATGPQFIYFFFDTTLPGAMPTLALLALLFVLLASFGILCTCEHLLAWVGSGLIAHLAFCIVVCGSVMRFRD
jgi:hypothetical protein